MKLDPVLRRLYTRQRVLISLQYKLQMLSAEFKPNAPVVAGYSSKQHALAAAEKRIIAYLQIFG